MTGPWPWIFAALSALIVTLTFIANQLNGKKCPERHQPIFRRIDELDRHRQATDQLIARYDERLKIISEQLEEIKKLIREGK